MGHSAVAYLLRKELADFAIRRRLPSMVPDRTEGTGGAVLSYGPDLADIFRKAAAYVAKILNGAKPADLPVERPDEVELVINLKTAARSGSPSRSRCCCARTRPFSDRGGVAAIDSLAMPASMPR